MAYCPSCDLEIPADSQKCPRCNAVFGPESAWRPLAVKSTVEPVAQSTAKPALDSAGIAGQSMKAAAAILIGSVIMAAGAAYGIFAYKVFTSLFSRSSSGLSGVMLVSFLAGIPIVIGVLVAYLARRGKITGLTGTGGMSVLTIFLFVFAAGAFLREGTICILMAAPFFVMFALLGAVLGGLIALVEKARGTKILSVALIAPFLAAPIEEQISSDTARQTTVRSIHIAGKPETVWRHLNFPLDIQPRELGDGFAYRIGVPYPVEARTIEGKVGGRRTLRWERGVTFEEVITAWEPDRHIAWTYKFGPDSFPAGSLDDHIVIGGRYFNLEATSYTLRPEGDGTRLTITVETSVTTNFNWYAGLWAKYLISDTAETILKFYKSRSESTREPS